MYFTRQKRVRLLAELLASFVVTLVALHAGASYFFTAILYGATFGMMWLLFTSLPNNPKSVHINPALSLGLWTLRKISTIDLFGFILAQVLGACAALGLDKYLIPNYPPLMETAFSTRLLIAEMVGTFVFGLGFAAALARSKSAPLEAALLMGTALFVGVLISFVAGNAILNPALAVGMRSITVAYIVGPLIGGVLGVNLYQRLFATE